MLARWQLVAVGSPRLVLEGPAAGANAPVLALGRKDAAWLVYVGARSQTASAALAALVWPEARGALNNLRQRVHRLRKETGARLIEMSENIVLATDLTVPPWPGRAELDADPAAGEGELLGAFEYDDAPEFAAWLAAQRRAWRERRCDALAASASAAEAAGEIARALLYAQRLRQHEPLSEHVHRRLMRLHYLRGDPAAAVAAFEACERLLKDELGLRPGEETLALLHSIERAALPVVAAKAPLPASLLRPPRCIGRDAERRQLAAAHDEGRIVALVAEAGMGKTRLLQDFIAGRADAVYAQARPGDAAVPYGSFARLVRALLAARPALGDAVPRDALAAVVPEFAGTAAAPEPAGRLPATLTRLLAAAATLGLGTLVLDDLHFADRASVEMLRGLVDAEPLVALRWAFAHRPIAAADEDRALLQSLADAPRACWITLEPLDEPSLRELLASLALPGGDAAGLARALHAHTGGNPLYVLETLRAARSGEPAAGWAPQQLPRPQSIAHLIDRRLARLGEPALALGRIAALAGPDFSPALAEHVLGTPALRLADAWSQLEAADVLRGNGFAHDLVRDGMLRATPAALAAHAHRVIAAYLQQHGGEPAALAAHWLAGGEPAAAALALRAAAQRAQRSGRPLEEAALLQRAGDAHAAAGDADAALQARLDAVPPTLRGAGVAKALELSGALLAQAGEGPLAGLAWTMHAVALAWAGRAVESEAAGRAALARLPADASAARFEAARTVAMVCGMQGRPADGFALLEPWLDRLDELPQLQDRIWFCGAAANLLLQADRPGEAIAMARRHSGYARAADDRLEQLSSQINAASAHVRRGDLGAAVAAAQEGVALAPDGVQAGVLIGVARAVLGYALCGLGRFRDGLSELESAWHEAEQGSPGSMLHVMAEDLLAQVYGRLGQRARALQLVAAEPAGLTGHRRANRLLLRAMLQPPSVSREPLLREAIELASDGPGVHVRMNALLVLAQESSEAQAVERCDMVLALAQAKEYHPLAAAAAAIRLGAWRRAGRLDRLAATVAEAERLVRRCDVPQAYWPELLLECALAHESLEQAADAQRCRADALAWARAALAQVPEAFRAGFIDRNLANAQLQLRAADAAAVSRS